MINDTIERFLEKSNCERTVILAPFLHGHVRVRLVERQDRGLLPLLRAVVGGTTDLDVRALPPAVVEHALETGLGPILAHVSARGPTTDSPYAARIRAADLTARVLTAEKFEAIEQVLAAADAAGCRVALLKGASTALRYYPAPHLRTMGDIDLLVDDDAQAALEASLRALGFEQRSYQPAAAFVNQHHSMPFYHSHRGVWIDVHTRLCPPRYPMAQLSRFSPQAVASGFSPIKISRYTAYAMRHELQLIYTSARWSETFDSQRGVYPLLDTALLLQKHGEALDWDYIRSAVRGSWAVTALRLMLSALSRWELACAPRAVLDWLAANDRHANRISIRLLHHAVRRRVLERPSERTILTDYTFGLIWSALLRPASVHANFLCVPYYVACPPGDPDRFRPVHAARRLRTVIRRTFRTAN